MPRLPSAFHFPAHNYGFIGMKESVKRDACFSPLSCPCPFGLGIYARRIYEAGSMSDLSNGATTALCSREHVVRSHLQIDCRVFGDERSVAGPTKERKTWMDPGRCTPWPGKIKIHRQSFAAPAYVSLGVHVDQPRV